jgi:hypothetical protein
MKKKEPKEESSFEMGQRFASFFLDLFNPKKLLAKISIGAIFMAAGIITLFKDAFLGLADYLLDAIKESFIKFVDYIGQFFKDVVKPILDELKTFFMEKIWPKIRDFFKPIFDWVGDKIKSILEFSVLLLPPMPNIHSNKNNEEHKNQDAKNDTNNNSNISVA